MRGGTVVAVLAVTLVGVAFAGLPVDAQEMDEPPESGSQATVDIGGSLGGDTPPTLVIGWTTTYPARTAEEARQARNESLDLSWFRGDDVLGSVAEQYPNATVRYNRTRVQYHQDEGDYGEIHVRASIRIEGLFRGGRERVTVGPTLGEALSDGERLTVTTPGSWTPANATDEGVYLRGDRLRYTWVIGEGPEPLLEYNRSGVPEADGIEDRQSPTFRVFEGLLILFGVLVFVLLQGRRGSDSEDGTGENS